MQAKEILEWCLLNLKGCILINSYGEQCIFYNPDCVLKRGIYVLTIKDKDGPNDTASNLNREGIFRVNMGLRKETFLALFNKLPVRPKASNVVSMDYNFSELGQILPHPVYAWMGWISILNPDLEQIIPYIEESYAYAKEKFTRRNKNGSYRI